MALHTLIRSCLCALLLVLFSLPAQACFGPKLFVAADQSPQQEALFALLTLYVEEKTGVVSVRVAIDEEGSGAELIAAEKADLAFTDSDSAADAVFRFGDLPLLISGPRPHDDLQFTTVLPAIRKLNRLLTGGDFEALVERIDDQLSPKAAAREFLMERRWI